jgi:hypothetical protein
MIPQSLTSTEPSPVKNLTRDISAEHREVLLACFEKINQPF